MPSSSGSPLRALTYLAPGLPIELFEIIADAIATELGRPVVLESDDRHSGPMHSHHDPFAAGEVDLGFLCSPSYIHLRSLEAPSVILVPAGLVFEDERTHGRPRYFSDVVVRTSHVAECFGDLEGCIWGYNDPCSLSGYLSARQRLGELGRGEDYFARQVETGSHLRSIEAILQRDIDAASIDSNVLQRLFAENPALEDSLRVVESLGPFPIQPVVIRAELADLVDPICDALLAIAQSPGRRRRLQSLGVRGFADVAMADYEGECEELRALGLIA